ncbi:MAG: hypothetical protein A2X48_12950 [Lentisphaerae bacterium GWF2_49_21]|nr:MAG: hypothetical protein A2X48_12950 [Lentisphaerae bacterium GWF2_49_21]
MKPLPTPKKQVEHALHGNIGAKVPFTIYESMIPQCAVERELRNRGLCIVFRHNVVKSYYPNVKIRHETTFENSRQLIRKYFETPYGTLSNLIEPAGFTVWHHEKLFKSPDDYQALRFLLQDQVFKPDYEAFAKAEQAFGEDAIFRTTFGLEPLQDLISGEYIKMQDFCMEWMVNRDEILKLYEILVEKKRSIYNIVAESPASHANYGGNVVAEIICKETFEEYFVPHYNEAAEAMHKNGKLIGCHFDANCSLIAESINSTDLDYVEAFTPAPDTDMTLAEARKAWPDKVLWINFPSSVHLEDTAKVKQITCELLEQTGSMEGLLMGITEDMPPEKWQQSCLAIMDGLENHAADHPEKYQLN